MKKILIIGVSGMLGSMVLDFLSKKRDIKVTGTLRDIELLERYKEKYRYVEFSVTPLDEIIFDNHDYIINCVGIIKQKLNNYKEAILINSIFPHTISERTQKAKIIHIATDCVFSGKNGLYSEKAEHDATDVYGRTKSLGEVNAKNIINVRTSIVGPDRRSKVSLLEWFLSQQKNAVIKGFANHYWNGITTLHFAKLCYALITKRRKIHYLLHFVPRDSINKYKLLKIFSEKFDRNDIFIEKFESDIGINRTLSTTYKKVNEGLWRDMGYTSPPTIEQMIEELAQYIKMKDFYEL